MISGNPAGNDLAAVANDVDSAIRDAGAPPLACDNQLLCAARSTRSVQIFGELAIGSGVQRARHPVAAGSKFSVGTARFRGHIHRAGSTAGCGHHAPGHWNIPEP